MAIATTGRADNGGVKLYYETFGADDDPVLLLICGLGVQLLSWPEELCEAFVDRGFRVVRFDNRDVGFSTWFDDHTGDGPAYLLSDMAADAVAVLDDLDVERAHIVGMSMGGMIAQTMAIEHPERVATLTSVASNTGEDGIGAPTEEALAALLAPPAEGREAVIEQDLAARRIWASTLYWDTDASRELLESFYDRSYHPEGAQRQTDAILSSGDRSAGLAQLDAPTLVVHADRDELISLSGGERTAELVPDSTLLIIEDMGHELPVQIWTRLVEAVTAHAAANATQ